MVIENTRGFTVIEVVLFLGISGLMFIGLFAGVTTLIANSRFQDSVFNLESFLQRQFDQSWNGVNVRDTAVVCGGGLPVAPGKADCLLLGRVLLFSPSSELISTYNVVGTKPASLASGLTVDQILAAYQPESVPDSKETYSIPWGTQFAAGKSMAGGGVNAVAFLRSPTTSRITAYHFLTSENGDSSISIEPYITASASDSANYCIEGADGAPGWYNAFIQFERGQGSSAIRANFDRTVSC